MPVLRTGVAAAPRPARGRVLRSNHGHGGAGLAAIRFRGQADPALLEDMVTANRIFYDQGVVDGFGHVSVRHGGEDQRCAG